MWLTDIVSGYICSFNKNFWGSMDVFEGQMSKSFARVNKIYLTCKFTFTKIYKRNKRLCTVLVISLNPSISIANNMSMSRYPLKSNNLSSGKYFCRTTSLSSQHIRVLPVQRQSECDTGVLHWEWVFTRVLSWSNSFLPLKIWFSFPLFLNLSCVYLPLPLC